jgi:ribosomal protein S19E (S16A)
LRWLLFQHLKRTGLAEERNAAIVITEEGRRVLRRLMSEA